MAGPFSCCGRVSQDRSLFDPCPVNYPDKMTPVFARLVALIGLAALVLTGAAAASARGHASIGGVMVICTGAGPVQIVVGADGMPVGPQHLCPDCAMTALAAPAQPSHDTTRDMSFVVAPPLRPLALPHDAAALLLPSLPRAPPALV